MVYVILITVCALLIALLNFSSQELRTALVLGRLILRTALGVLAVILWDGVLAFFVRRLPERWFSPEARAFFVGKREHALYRRLGIKKWKKFVPEWGCFTGFHKDRVRAPFDRAYIGRFLLESNYGVLGHLAGAVLGYALLLCPRLLPLPIALPIAFVNFVLNLLPLMILRCNTPALRRLYRRGLAREGRKEEGNEGAPQKEFSL